MIGFFYVKKQCLAKETLLVILVRVCEEVRFWFSLKKVGCFFIHHNTKVLFFAITRLNFVETKKQEFCVNCYESN